MWYTIRQTHTLTTQSCIRITWDFPFVQFLFESTEEKLRVSITNGNSKSFQILSMIYNLAQMFIEHSNALMPDHIVQFDQFGHHSSNIQLLNQVLLCVLFGFVMFTVCIQGQVLFSQVTIMKFSNMFFF